MSSAGAQTISPPRGHLELRSAPLEGSCRDWNVHRKDAKAVGLRQQAGIPSGKDFRKGRVGFLHFSQAVPNFIESDHADPN